MKEFPGENIQHSALCVTMELIAMVMFYSALLGATLPARALEQGLICFNLLSS